MSEVLPAADAARLAERETVIERGLGTFVEVGTALAEIRDDRLYRAKFATFEDYCQERWNLKRAHAYRMIDAAAAVSPIGDTGLPMPANEGQARELARVPVDQRAEIWEETLDRTEGKPTAAAIRETVERPNPYAAKHVPAEGTQWSPAERELQTAAESGETVVASLRGDHEWLLRWAEVGGRLVRIDRRTEWGNPFEMPADGDRATVIKNYEDHYLPNKPSLTAKVHNLQGKVLACWCAPEPCHGDVLAAWADGRGEQC